MDNITISVPDERYIIDNFLSGAAQPLPPASFQRFLLKRNTTPGVVVADHEKEFVNEYYNSRFDNTDYLGVDINVS